MIAHANWLYGTLLINVTDRIDAVEQPAVTLADVVIHNPDA